jgi:hypothetical protein
VEAVTKVNVFTSSLSTDASFQNVLCGGNTNSVVVVAQTTSEQLCTVVEILNDIGLFMQCSNWFPLYENTVYNAMCYSGTDGFAWVASTQFVIVFMAMFILTFRVVFYDIEISEPPRKVTESDKEEGGEDDGLEIGDDDDNDEGNGIGEDEGEDGNGIDEEDKGNGNGIDDKDEASRDGGREKPRDNLSA